MSSKETKLIITDGEGSEKIPEKDMITVTVNETQLPENWIKDIVKNIDNKIEESQKQKENYEKTYAPKIENETKKMASNIVDKVRAKQKRK